MTYSLRERPDGMVEIIQLEPVLIGIFPARATAELVLEILSDEAIDWPEPAMVPDVSGTAEADVVLVEDDFAPAGREPAEIPDAETADKPPVEAEEIRKAKALARLARGERLADVAREVGIDMNRLRGMWARSKRGTVTGPDMAMAKETALLKSQNVTSTKVECLVCGREFRPSATNLDLCARCSRG